MSLSGSNVTSLQTGHGAGCLNYTRAWASIPDSQRSATLGHVTASTTRRSATASTWLRYGNLLAENLLRALSEKPLHVAIEHLMRSLINSRWPALKLITFKYEQRLEGLNKLFGTEIIISDNTYKLVKVRGLE